MAQTPKPAAEAPASFREPLLSVPFSIRAILAQGRMTVARLLDLRPGSIVRSETTPGGRIRLYAGKALLAEAEAIVQDGNLSVRIEDPGGEA